MRFSIRDLLWLTVVVALGIAWWVDRTRLVETIEGQSQWLDYYEVFYRTEKPNHAAPPPDA
jgi:hypothetical protein